jgi:hypothetical protein
MLWIHQRASSLLYAYVRSCAIGTWLLPVNICHYVPAAILKAGHSIRLIDIEAQSLCINQDEVLSICNDPEVRGLIFVDMYGYETPVQSFFQTLKTHRPDLCIIHDKCLGWPDWKTPPSSTADLELHSTGYAKCINLGRGGFAKSNHDLSQVLATETHNDFKLMDARYFEIFFKSWINGAPKSSELNSIIHSAWLPLDQKKLPLPSDYISEIEAQREKIEAHKIRLNCIYQEELKDIPQLNILQQTWRFTLLLPEADRLLSSLQTRSLFASRHYYPLNRIFSSSNSFPVWEGLYSSIVNLFNDFCYTPEMAYQTTKVVRQHWRKYRGHEKI